MGANSKKSNGKIQWSGGNALIQDFPFPDTVMYYIATNPSSSEVYSKYIQSCKYFYATNPIIVVQELFESRNNKESGGTRIYSNEKHTITNDRTECCVKIDLRSIKSKIWIKTRLVIHGSDIPNFCQLLSEKLYQFNFPQFFISHQTMSWEIFKLFAPSIQHLYFIAHVNVVYNDGKTVMLDKILEACPKIEVINYNCEGGASMLAASTLKDVAKLPNQNLKIFELDNLPQIFDIQDVTHVLTKELKESLIILWFDRNIEDEYKSQLVELHKMIMKTYISKRLIYIFPYWENPL